MHHYARSQRRMPTGRHFISGLPGGHISVPRTLADIVFEFEDAARKKRDEENLAAAARSAERHRREIAERDLPEPPSPAPDPRDPKVVKEDNQFAWQFPADREHK